MRPFSIQPAAWLLLLSLVWLATTHSALAASSRPRPFRRISHASDISLDLVSRQSSTGSAGAARRSGSEPQARDTYLPRRLARAEPVLPHDSLRLSFRAFGQLFHLHLEPNDDFLHPDGIVVNQGSSSEYRLERNDVKAYHGYVVEARHSGKRAIRDAVGVKDQLLSSRSSVDGINDDGVVGRAAIVIHDDGALTGRAPSFEGTFDWDGNVHFVSSASTYSAIRSPLDPAISPSRRDLENDSVIVHRMSDMLSHDEESQLMASRGLEQPRSTSNINTANAGCTSDNHEFNVNNHLFATGINDDDFSRSPLSFFVAKSAHPSNLFSRSLFADLIAAPDRRQARDVEGEPLEDRDHPRRFSYSSPVRRQTGNDIAGGGANSSFVSDIGSRTGCPTSARVVYIGVAADCSYTARLGGDENAVRRRLLGNMNSVSSLYRSTYNISLGVTALEVRGSTCPSSPSSTEQWNSACSDSFTLDARLSAFSRWRGTQDGSTGLWHLLTACSTGTEVGVAWLGTVCRTEVSSSSGDSVSGTGVTASTTIESQIIAHEVGHNFGAIHDCTQTCGFTATSARQGARFGGATCCPLSSSTCDAGGGFIMNPSSSGQATAFSSCSIGNVCTLLGRGLNTSCIVTPGSRATLSTQQCGNGFASNTTVCRPAVDARCDVAETCSGTSAECPTDVTEPDGTSCASGLRCAAGVCTSRDLQCQQAGSSLNVTRACPTSFDTGCSIACRDPDNFSSCLVLQQTFVDGTPCRWGGRCENGECQTGSWQDVFKGWYRDNLRISIPVTIVVGVLVLLLLWALLRCIINACFRRRGGAYSAPSSSYRRRRGRSGQDSRPPSGWVDPAPWNGANGRQSTYQQGYNASQPYDTPAMGYAPPTGPPPPPPPRY
ncbi:hypothetical protein OC835_006266 [Tilletia horrida]|nr:hypothetical protein OC835_006266 [Tilletia horrida]